MFSQAQSKPQENMTSLEAPVNEPLPSMTSQQQIGNAGRHSADAPQLPESKGDPSSCHNRMRSEHPSTPNNRKPPQRADRFKTPSRLRWSYQLIGMTILAPLAAGSLLRHVTRRARMGSLGPLAHLVDTAVPALLAGVWLLFTGARGRLDSHTPQRRCQ
jgi:hypothetical protein